LRRRLGPMRTWLLAMIAAARRGAGFGTGIDRADARDREVMPPMLPARLENPLKAPDQQAMGRALGCEAV
jgi:hypothetical protein